MMSEEIDPTRQISDFRHGVKQVGGDLSQEMSYGTQDDWFEAVMCGTWAAKAAPVTGTGISAAASDNSINFAANNAPLVDPGDKITIAGFTGTAGNNRAGAVVVSRTASKIVISGGAALVDDAAGEEVTITTLTEQLKAGTTRRSFSFLRHFTDQLEADEPFYLYKGCELNTMALTIGVEGILKAVFAVVGVDSPVPSGTAPAGSTYVAANTNPVMDSFSGSLKEGGIVLATVTEVTASLENGITPRPTVGSDVAQIRASIGRSNGTGQIATYFENSTLYKKFVTGAESSLDLSVGDGAGRRYRFYWPRIKYNGGQPDTSGQGPIMTTLPFQALKDATLGSQLIIERTA
jgi:hypothetical protein